MAPSILMKITGNWCGITSRLACFAAPLIFGSCLLVPARNWYLNTLMAATLVTSFLGWIIREWHRPLIRFTLMAVALLPVALLCLPGRPASTAEALAPAYTQALQRYTGTTYWWGGETRLGIDCSGLMRAGMMDASLYEGVTHLDGAVARHALDLWWHDESAEALGEGYRGLTVPVCTAPSINSLDHSLVRAGDLAIAGAGVHVLAYLGDHRWIQADPGPGRVIIETTPSKNSWFLGPVKIVRWTCLVGER